MHEIVEQKLQFLAGHSSNIPLQPTLLTATLGTMELQKINETTISHLKIMFNEIEL